ncbi:tyrosine-type recombinase/integrase [Natrialbaceae archaeon A-CW1-1]
MVTSPEDNDSNDPEGYRSWSHDLAALQEIGEELLEQWRTENLHSPRDYPAVRWLTDNGYSHLRWVLREKHDMGTPEFFVLLTSAGGSKKFEWGIDDVATIERANSYLDDRVVCRGWRPSTKRTQRARLNEFLRRFSNEYGDDRILAIANDPELETEVYDSFKEVIKSLRKDLTSDDSTHHYVRAAHRFFEWLDRSGRIAYDPMENIEDEFRWDWHSDSTPLAPEQVRRLWIVAETDEERMLVIGYCIWGVRTKELPAVHIDQINLKVHDSYIDFEEPERKNGQGQVTLIFGLEALANLIDKHAQRPDWNGYLFPSNKKGRSFLSSRTMLRRFRNLCEKAGVTVDGDYGTPKHGRAFYYNILAEAETDLLDTAGKIAEEQGSSDAATVRDFYLTPEQRRRYRHVFFRKRIRQILPDDAYTEYNTRTDFDSSLDDFE